MPVWRRFLAPLVLVLAIGSVWLGPTLVWRQLSATPSDPAAGDGDARPRTRPPSSPSPPG